jgi:hypothetical protein
LTTNTLKLKRSNDRKVANLVTKNGKQAAIANTFGLPAGKQFSCPGATSVCETVCYAGKLEKLFKGVKTNLLHNWDLLKDADLQTMYTLLSEMIAEFKTDCVKKDAPMLFRIHWDGDFFNDDYTQAWRMVIEEQPDIQFWVYTRVKSAALILINSGVRLAYLAKNFAIGQADMKEIMGKPGAKCPENNKQIPLISNAGSACVSCSLCVYSKADIVFSATKK